MGIILIKGCDLCERNGKYEYWLEAATYDLDSARVMMDGGIYLNKLRMTLRLKNT